MTSMDALHREWMKNPEYASEYEALRPEFELAAAIIDARAQAGLTQEELAARMQVKQPFVARLEGGARNTTMKTLHRIAEATGTELNITFRPVHNEPRSI